LKLNAGRNVDTVQWAGIYADTNPTTANVGAGTPPQTTRSWTDANRNFVPDCNLLNLAQQDLRGSGGDFCGAADNARFGQAQTPTNTYDPALLGGWGIRPRNLQFGASIQQEVLPRVAVEVGYAQRWFPTFSVTDNRAVTPADYDRYKLTAPLDSRLPGGGGYVIDDLTNISTTAFGRTDNFVSIAENYGNSTEYWHGVDVNVNARLKGGLTVQGGTSTGRRITDTCELGINDNNGNLAVDDPSRRNCQVTLPFTTDIRGLVAYTIPKLTVQLSATMQSRPGPQIVANWVVSSAVVAQSLGRPLSGGAANVTVNVLNPGQMYGDRVSQLDFRVAKILRFGRTRTNVGIDLYNVTNSSVALTYNNTFGTTWLRPTTFMPARFVKLTGQLSF
jgi:hypothetical protein